MTDGSSWAEAAVCTVNRRECGTCRREEVRSFVSDAVRVKRRKEADGLPSWSIPMLHRELVSRFNYSLTASALQRCIAGHIAPAIDAEEPER